MCLLMFLVSGDGCRLMVAGFRCWSLAAVAVGAAVDAVAAARNGCCCCASGCCWLQVSRLVAS